VSRGWAADRRMAAMDSLRFGLGIRALRRRRGLRQHDVAAAVGVSQSWVSRLERGALGEFSVGLVERIANAQPSASHNRGSRAWSGAHSASSLSDLWNGSPTR
jgi:transcriptional regulator with XRE-family HTH domain